MLGTRHPAALGVPFKDAWPDVWDEIEPLVEQVFAGETVKFDNMPLVMTRRGYREDTWWNFSYSPVRDESGAVAGLLNVTLDATERKRAERAEQERDEANASLRENEKRLSALVRASSDVIYTMSPDWAEMRRLEGRGFITDTDAPTVKWAEEYLYPEDRHTILNVVAQAIASEGVYELEHRVRRADGSEGWTFSRAIAVRGLDGEIIEWFGTAADVTDAHASRAALLEVEERLRLAGRATNDAVWDWDLRTNQVTWNIALQAAYGHRLEDIEPTGAWWIAHIHVDDRERIVRSIHGAIDSSTPDWNDEYRFERADGSYADVLDRGYVLRDSAGKPLRMVGAMLDVSARKAVERQLEEDRRRLLEEVEAKTAERDRAEDALRQAQKMEAVGQLTGGLAHDFNNMLAGISGALQLMQLRLAQGRVGELERYSTAAQGAVRRAAALTHRLLAFSRRQTLDPKPVNANRLIFDIEELIRRTVGPQVEVETIGKTGVWTTLVDPNQLENSIVNLCINARDAMPDGGRITIEAGNEELDKAGGQARDLPPGHYVSIRVTDAGTGMSPEVAARAFDPFFTTKPLGEGTGLGLSMVYGFARQSGGQVQITSEVGVGTTICIYLPRHLTEAEADEGAQLSPVSILNADGAKDAGSVLVVDDEPSVRMLVVEVAQELGFGVVEAADGPGALRMLRDYPDVNLLITDVGLPGGMNGRQVADAALQLHPRLRVLFITGYAESAVIGNGQLAPNMGLLTKPFSIDVLAERIRTILA
ncbi:histidine kinase [Bordetella sp. N]|nr:histidine kinase [Bordetella sp. N]